MKAPQEKDVKALFDELEKQTKTPTMLGDNQTDHRYADVGCPKKTAVLVEIDGEDKYLHANTVEIEDGKPTILTQYPCMSGNELFWKQAWTKSNLIVDLMLEDDLPAFEGKNYPTGKLNLQSLDLMSSEIKELEDFSKKIDLTEDDIISKMEALELSSAFINSVNIKEVLGLEMKFGSMLVIFENKTLVLGKEDDSVKTVRYNYIVKEGATGVEKNVSRLNFEGWEDYSGTSVDKLMELVEYVDATIENEFPGTIPIVHCRAGVGRTGTFVTARILMHLYKSGKLDKANFIETLFKIILKGREERGPMFVQRDSQLQTLIELGKKLLQK